MGTSPGHRLLPEQGWNSTHDAHAATEREVPRVSRPGTKRPLSSFLHSFDQPTERPAAKSPPRIAQWPSTALELLAAAAPAYDKLIAGFPRGTTQGALIGVFGCGPGLGTTTTAICLALRSATHGTSTLLVDANVASPTLAEQLALPVEFPWIRSLREGAPLERAIVSGGEVAIDLLLAQLHGEHELDPWARFHVGNAAGQMRRRYQRTLVDLGHHLTAATEVIATLAIDEIVLVGGPATMAEELQRVEQALTIQGQYVSGTLRAA